MVIFTLSKDFFKINYLVQSPIYIDLKVYCEIYSVVKGYLIRFEKVTPRKSIIKV